MLCLSVALMQGGLRSVTPKSMVHVSATRPSDKRVVGGQQGPQSVAFMFPAGRYFNPGWGRVSTAWHFFRIQTQVRSSGASRSTCVRPIFLCGLSMGAGIASKSNSLCLVHA